jgi:D-alanyl-D-alanine dipeptidase
MRMITVGLSIFILFFSCSDVIPSKKVEAKTNKIPKPTIEAIPSEKLKDTTFLSHYNLVDVQSLNKDIFVELKYATSDNFMGIVLYDRLKNAYLQKDVAERLSKVQDYLSELKPGFHLLIYDALRPVSVQQKMWDALDSLPPAQRGKFVSNPKNRSLHNLGAAVDLTIVNQNGEPLDMGARYDDIRQIAYPSKEKQFLAEGKLSAVHIENRDLLRKVMKSQKFRQLQTEWWHFNACSRDEGLLKYKVLLVEP